MNSRQALRDRLALNATTRREVVTVTLGDGPVELAVRELTVGQINNCVERAGKSEAEQTVRMMMEAVRVPDTDERLWDDLDIDLVNALPPALFKDLAEAVTRVNHVVSKEQAEGNSDAIPLAVSSSSSPAN